MDYLGVIYSLFLSTTTKPIAYIYGFANNDEFGIYISTKLVGFLLDLGFYSQFENGSFQVGVDPFFGCNLIVFIRNGLLCGIFLWNIPCQEGVLLATYSICRGLSLF